MLFDALATYRLTRLATADVITQPLRDRIIEWSYERAGRRDEAVRASGPMRHEGDWQDAVLLDDDPPKLATLVTCRWCAGIWIAAFVVLASRVAPRAWRPARDLLVFSAAAALIARIEDD